MADALKLMYNQSFFDQFATKLGQAYPLFDTGQFISLIFDEHWEERELKRRIRHISHVLTATLPESYREALEVLSSVADACSGFPYLFFPDFVELNGLDDWEASLPALALFTRYSSAEFAVRPFIMQDAARMMAQMERWAQDDNEHVRRLASEGCRPRLPWGMALEAFKADPAPILPILDKLKADASEYVRRSVANNLNDISKDHPELVLSIARDWYGNHPHTDWVVKHACRGLLKKGHPNALALFGFHGDADVEIRDLALSAPEVAIGGRLGFSFQLRNNGSEAKPLRIEYGIDFVKASGKTSRKLFKLSESAYKPGVTELSRSQSFQDFTTRKHYPGTHRLSIVVNGAELAEISFEVVG